MGARRHGADTGFTKNIHGFTLIELLVVVAIIAVLIAILTPSLQRARYMAQLVVCGTRIRAMGMTVLIYTEDFETHYPDRYVAQNTTATIKPTCLAHANFGYDLRRQMAGYLDFDDSSNSPIHCPLQPQRIDYTGTAVNVECALGLWFGYVLAPGEQPMRRQGDRLTFDGSEFDVLVSDWLIDEDAGGVYGGLCQASHLDRKQIMGDDTRQNAAELLTRWGVLGRADRGKMDMNIMFQDGSVQLYSDIVRHDPRFTMVYYGVYAGYRFPLTHVLLPAIGQ
jgi:prepilin-type N-terminal cleavage/methylation domain-containing protein